MCGRTFVWRKRWRNTWDRVRYCSARCRRARFSPETCTAVSADGIEWVQVSDPDGEALFAGAGPTVVEYPDGVPPRLESNRQDR